MESKVPPRADLITAVILIVLGIAVAYGSWVMPRLEVRGIHPASVPGMVPGVLGVLLALCGAILGFRAWAARAERPSEIGGEPRENRKSEFRRLGVTAALCLVYALGLVGTLPFWLATAIFVLSFVIVFEVPLGETRGSLGRTAVIALVLAAVAGVSVSYIFQELFLVRLP